jgi:hypothetical protein
MLLNPNFRDILSIFAGQKVEYLVVGAYALATHGLPRATGDLDLWIGCTPENVRRVMSGLTEFGAPMDQIQEADLLLAGTVFQIGVSPNRIDILTAIDGVKFQEAWASRHSAQIGDLEVPVISREHLIRNKRALGRTKDVADAEWLEGRDG